ncbi:Aldehyde dehydrogenase [Fusarium culmorum]|uniref:Aldehyde dehydrogenase n=1 Tax=Fusarium culmorum TaxID=5516 RepID=A0A2T4HAP4_FUSCU|nr:Aldehyde dehydrogenase [Fusarium culmorum]
MSPPQSPSLPQRRKMVSTNRPLHQQRIRLIIQFPNPHLNRPRVSPSPHLISLTLSLTLLSTENEIATVQAADAQDIDKAVKAAKAALRHPSWKDLPASDRGQLMARLADLIEAKRELFATIDAWDNGKTYIETLENDLVEAVGVIRYYSGWADKTFGQTINTTPQKFAYTIRQPIGVIAQIIPWNYPLSMATWKLGPALACGNAVVIKAAEQTPLSLLVLGELIKEAGFPPGVVNIVNGLGKDTGAALVQHPLVDKIAFTGSTATAANIMGVAAKTLKNITLETGGKSPLIVFDDAEMDQAVKWSHFGIMSNQGQICTATSRILVQETIYEEFIKKFIDTLNTVSKVGDQWDKTTYQGPQVSKVQYERILEYIEIGKKEGATLAAGGGPSRSTAQTKDSTFPHSLYRREALHAGLSRRDLRTSGCGFYL